MENRRTANYKVIADPDGFRFQFFCDLSDVRVCTVKVTGDYAQEQALDAAWKTEGRKKFNHCEKCGRWISDAMYNSEVHECVKCAPWENYPLYCHQCGRKITDTKKYCPWCGALLRYEGS